MAGIEGIGPDAWLAAPHGCGAVLLAVVGILGSGLLVLGWRLRTAFRRLETVRHEAERARQRELVEAQDTARIEQTLSAEQTAGDVAVKVNDLLEIRSAIQALIERAEAAQQATESETTAA